MHDVAVLVAEDLELHVARPIEVLLDVDPALAERLLRLGARLVERAAQRDPVARHAHAAPAAAGGRLDEHGITDLVGHPHRLLLVLDQPVGTGHDRHLGGRGAIARGRLVPQLANRVTVRPDELDAVVATGVGELAVLAQETVAGVDRIDIGHLRRGDDAGDGEVGLRARPRADADLFVREVEVARVAVGLGIDRDRIDVHLASGPQDAQGDLAPVGNEDALEHGVMPAGRRKALGRTRPPRRSARRS